MIPMTRHPARGTIWEDMCARYITRKLGVGFAALNRAGEPVSNYSWKDILVSGELKENDSDDTTPARGTIWEDMCARYITRRTLAASATASHCAGR
jgi:hypothetical protein